MHKSRKQSDSSARKILIKMVLSSDHLTAATSKTVTVNISKNGGSFGAAGGSVAELSGGFYHYTPSSTDLNTLGELVLVASATDCDNYEDKYVVVPYDVFDCIDGNTTKFGGTAGTFSSGRPEVNTTHLAGTSQTARDIGASVLLSNGVGTGQISLSSGNVSLVPAASIVISQFTASAGASSSVTMSPVLGLPDDTIRGGALKIISGTGSGQYRRISGYNNTTGVISVAPNWVTTPDATSVCVIEYGAMPTVDTSGNVSVSGGGSSDWTADEKTVIKAVLGIPASGTTPDDPTTGILDTIRDAVITVDTVVDAIKAKTDNIPSDPADASDISSAFGTVNSTLATIAGYIDTEVSAIKAKTDNLPASPASTSDVTSATSGLATASALATVEGKIDVIDGIVDTLNTDLYTAYIEFVDDNTAVADEYSVRWRKNGVNVTSGITTPLIQVIKFDGTDLVASTAMSQIGTTGAYKYTESTNRIATGQNYEIKCTATIDGSARTFSRIISRDS